MTKEQLNKHFVDWFYNQNWVQGYNRNGWMRDHYNNLDADQRHYWMLEAFQAGFELKQQLECAELDAMFALIDDMDELDNTNGVQVQQFATKCAWPFPGE